MSHYFLHKCMLILALSAVYENALAVQWQSLNGTTRYKVAYDEQSVRLTPRGRLEVWLRFIPRGESERKTAGTEYKEKRYRSHLEYYEIDCSEQTALLGLVDILGPSRARLNRIQGGTQPDPILPGSVLDNAARHICPVLDEDADKTDETGENDTAAVPDVPGDTTLSDEKKLQLELLQKKAASPEATAETWKELGNIYFDSDQPEQAISAYDHALALKPDDTDVLNDQGAMYRQTGNFERALTNFERALSLSPNNLESLYNSGYVYAFDLNNIAKALILWRNYLKFDSKSEKAQQVQSYIERYGR